MPETIAVTVVAYLIFQVGVLVGAFVGYRRGYRAGSAQIIEGYSVAPDRKRRR